MWNRPFSSTCDPSGTEYLLLRLSGTGRQRLPVFRNQSILPGGEGSSTLMGRNAGRPLLLAAVIPPPLQQGVLASEPALIRLSRNGSRNMPGPVPAFLRPVPWMSPFCPFFFSVFQAFPNSGGLENGDRAGGGCTAFRAWPGNVRKTTVIR